MSSQSPALPLVRQSFAREMPTLPDNRIGELLLPRWGAPADDVVLYAKPEGQHAERQGLEGDE
jgi:hypothetical protein